MFDIGQKVLYGIHGVCCITAVEIRSTGKEKKEYYCLEPVDQQGAVFYVPTSNPAAVAKMLDSARMMAQAKKPVQPEEEDPEDQQAVEDTAYFQARQRIAELLSNLDEADAKLLTLRFGLEGGKPLAPEETGKKLGLTPEEVVAREAAALAKLRSSR